MSNKIIIAIDAMGGDDSPHKIIKGISIHSKTTDNVYYKIFGNKKLIDWAKIFLDLSKKGLERRNETNKNGKNETIYLKHIEQIINNKKTRAEMLIDQYNKSQDLNFLINHDENFSYSGF